MGPNTRTVSDTQVMPVIHPDYDTIKLSHCPPQLKTVAEGMIHIFGSWLTTINGRKIQIIGDDLYEKRKRTMVR